MNTRGKKIKKGCPKRKLAKGTGNSNSVSLALGWREVCSGIHRGSVLNPLICFLVPTVDLGVLGRILHNDINIRALMKFNAKNIIRYYVLVGKMRTQAGGHNSRAQTCIFLGHTSLTGWLKKALGYLAL